MAIEAKPKNIWNKIGTTISQTATTAVQKTKDVADIGRLNLQISGEEREIDRLYGEIGKQYMNAHGNDPDAELLSLVQRIREAQQTIAECQAQIQAIRGIKTCNTCGAEIAENAAYCMHCGAKQYERGGPEVREVACEAKEELSNVPCGAKFVSGTGADSELRSSVTRNDDADDDIRKTKVPVAIVVSEESSDLEESLGEDSKSEIFSCPICGTVLAEGAVFCAECGLQVGESDD